MSVPQDDESHLSIRPATTQDIPALLQLIEPLVEEGRLIERTTEEMDELVKTGFLVEIHQQIVGFAALEIYSKKMAEIRSLAVLPIWQGKGIGQRLINACVELAREKNVYEVMAITATEAVFQKCGFDFTLPNQRKALFYQTREQP